MFVSSVGVCRRAFAVAVAFAALIAPSAAAAPLDPDGTVLELSYANVSPLTYGTKWLRRFSFEVRRGHARLVVHGQGDAVLGQESRPVPEAMWSKLLADASALPSGEEEGKRSGRCFDAGIWSITVVDRGRTVKSVARDCPDDEQVERFFVPVDGLFDMAKYQP
ncbi:hypothetical protein [Segniliparus rugosus]|uniref:Uncharacterized protein n=1 Tax=Segniliparus rugosus (strain ATCC BAA-974 / DSM 45345 / CCUG 50838 / CIP 108380 / JCM 13579 / CDC 945) TaxID=679197 RepID=E5XP73_SEGRC|nr:hypothetical protein [Segniliparus rugosus]EFV13855.1 hypothetical protein HMPREF9336_01294 [Segniliparus rugosus ATCC BAA-974]